MHHIRYHFNDGYSIRKFLVQSEMNVEGILAGCELQGHLEFLLLCTIHYGEGSWVLISQLVYLLCSNLVKVKSWPLNLRALAILLRVHYKIYN